MTHSPLRSSHDVKPRPVADTLGVLAASVCALHCVALPVLLSAAPLLPLSSLLDPWVEWALVGTSLLIGAVSFRDGVRSTIHRAPLALFLAGMSVLLMVRVLVDEDAPVIERVGLVAGASLIASAHVLRARRAARLMGDCKPSRDSVH